MKVLVVSAVLPYPLHSGGQIRLYNLLKRLAKGDEIHLYSFIRSEKEKEYLPALSFCKTITTVMRGGVWQPKYLLETLVSSYPLLWTSYHNGQMLSLLSDEIARGNYDLIHIEPGYVWPSIPTEHRVPIVVSEHNVEHLVYKGYADGFHLMAVKPFLLLDVKKMRIWEKRAWTAASHVISVSQADKNIMGTLVDPSHISVVPNGVDIQSFPFRPKKTFPKDSPTFLYVGNFLWMENRDAANYVIKDLWPILKTNFLSARLRIVGKQANDYIMVKKDPSISIEDSVEVIQDELRNADIMLAPIRIGGGTKYKILEAMASGLPVITSSVGAQGMKGLHGKHYHVADSPAAILRAVQDLTISVRRLAIVRNARALVEKEYSWDAIAKKQYSVWQDYAIKH